MLGKDSGLTFLKFVKDLNIFAQDVQWISLKFISIKVHEKIVKKEKNRRKDCTEPLCSRNRNVLLKLFLAIKYVKLSK